MIETERAGIDSTWGILKRLWPEPPRAAGFIVTIYGDVVEPRGGVLWMGNLIEICKAVGISESLVRTAVSRLVAAGQLLGERDGRRSFYRLTDEARVEFLQAAKVLFDPEPAPTRWLFASRCAPEQEAALLRQGFAVAGSFLIGPDRGGEAGLPGPVFRAEPVADLDELPDFAAKYWDLASLAAAYRNFLGRYEALVEFLSGGRALSGREALTVRLMLVHDFRAVLLWDPRLPEAALPADWLAAEARKLFAELYRLLSPESDRYIGAHLESDSGRLPAETAVTQKRLQTIAGNFIAS